jgi:hypothetical protein
MPSAIEGQEKTAVWAYLYTFIFPYRIFGGYLNFPCTLRKSLIEVKKQVAFMP